MKKNRILREMNKAVDLKALTELVTAFYPDIREKLKYSPELMIRVCLMQRRYEDSDQAMAQKLRDCEEIRGAAGGGDPDMSVPDEPDIRDFWQMLELYGLDLLIEDQAKCRMQKRKRRRIKDSDIIKKWDEVTKRAAEEADLLRKSQAERKDETALECGNTDSGAVKTDAAVQDDANINEVPQSAENAGETDAAGDPAEGKDGADAAGAVKESGDRPEAVFDRKIVMEKFGEFIEKDIRKEISGSVHRTLLIISETAVLLCLELLIYNDH